MKKAFTKAILLIMNALIIISAFAGCGKTEGEGKFMYTNLSSVQMHKQILEIMSYAGISEGRQKVLSEHINQFNSIVSAESLASEFEAYNPDKPRYDPYDMQNEWEEKSPDFMGYNCRITAFSLFRDFLDIDKGSEIRDDIIMLDLFALNEDSSALVNEDEKAFSVFYSTVPTTLTKDVDVHVKNLQEDWQKRNIKFLDNEKVSLINVVFHECFDENENYLYIGHSGVLFDYNGKLYFLEKLAFQEPYQLTEFTDRSELNDYLMAKYNTAFDQPVAEPFVMENDKLLN